MEIPTSPDNQNTLISLIEDYWLLFKRRWPAATLVFLAVLAISIVRLLFEDPIYEAEGKILVKKIGSTPSLTGLGKEVGEVSSLQDQANPISTEAEVIESVPLIEATIKQLDLKNSDGVLLQRKEFLENLSVSAPKGVDLLTVSYQDTDPRRTAKVVNTLMNLYLESNLRNYRFEAIAARQFIEEQLPRAEEIVSQAETKLRQFKEENNVIDIGQEITASVNLLASFQEQITATESELADVNMQYEVSLEQLGLKPQQAIISTVLSQSSGVQEVLKAMQEVESKLAIERTRFQDNSPNIIALNQQLSTLESLLQERIYQVVDVPIQTLPGNLQASSLQHGLTRTMVPLEGQRQGLLSRVEALSRLQVEYQNRAEKLPRLEKQERELERKLNAAQSTYTNLLQKFQELRITESQNLGNARILSPAVVPKEYVAPSKTLYLATGIVFGGMMAVGTALVLDILDPSVKTAKEAKMLYGFSLLTVLPPGHSQQIFPLGGSTNQKLSSSALAILDAECLPTPTSSAYRRLQINLDNLTKDSRSFRTIVVTSAVSQEGKSMVCANLAAAKAHSGCKTLLIDANLYAPTQEHLWHLSPIEESAHPLFFVPHPFKVGTSKVLMHSLDIAIASRVLQKAPGLLYSQKIVEELQTLFQPYDFVIIDTPALDVSPDALLLGKLADGIVLVTQPGRVKTGQATQAKNLLTESEQTILGQVINEERFHSQFFRKFVALFPLGDFRVFLRKILPW